MSELKNLKFKEFSFILQNYIDNKDNEEIMFKEGKFDFTEYYMHIQDNLERAKKLIENKYKEIKQEFLYKFQAGKIQGNVYTVQLAELDFEYKQIMHMFAIDKIHFNYKKNLDDLIELKKSKQINEKKYQQAVENLKIETVEKITKERKKLISELEIKDNKKMLKSIKTNETTILALIEKNLTNEIKELKEKKERRKILKNGAGVLIIVSGLATINSGISIINKIKTSYKKTYPLNPQFFKGSYGEEYSKENLIKDLNILQELNNIKIINEEYIKYFTKNKEQGYNINNIKLINQRIEKDINNFLNIYRNWKNVDVLFDEKQFKNEIISNSKKDMTINSFIELNKSKNFKPKNLNSFYKLNILSKLLEIKMELTKRKNKNDLEEALLDETSILYESYQKLFENQELEILQNTSYVQTQEMEMN